MSTTPRCPAGAGDVRISRALKAGARGYLLKSLLRKELLDTIRAVHAGQKKIPADILPRKLLITLRMTP